MHNKFVERKRKSIINPSLSISGHKELESLKSYNQTPMNIQKQMTNISGDIDIHRYTGTGNLDIYLKRVKFRETKILRE